MALVWDLARLKALSPDALAVLYKNAEAKPSTEAKSLVQEIIQSGLLQQLKISGRKSGNTSRTKALVKPWSAYRQITIEIYNGPSRGKQISIRTRPVEGQFYPVTMNVECSKDMRRRFAGGTRFRIYAKEVTTKNGVSFLYTHYDWPADVISE